MLGHGNENRISFFGYFGFGWPLFGFLLSLAMIVLLVMLDWPVPGAFFAILSIGFLYGVYKSCQTTGREGVNVPRMRTRAGDHPLELTASALPADHPGFIGSFPAHTPIPGLIRSPAGEDEPPDYYEVTGISKSSVETSRCCLNSTNTGGESGWPTSASLTSASVGDFESSPVALFRLPSYDEAVASCQRLSCSDSITAE
ncbi:uncharacterized protein [Palaemon carinicauda]|uniref:uncharacterized protein n=1 Tax=Palaemon carinicauda TaxID=392227 RepID=UPI0035B650BA